MKSYQFVISAVLWAVSASALAVAPVEDSSMESLQPAPRMQTVGQDSQFQNVELFQQVQQLQQQLQALRGQLEVQQHTIKQMRREQRALYSDLDQRLSKTGAGADSAGFDEGDGSFDDAPATAPGTAPATAKPAAEQHSANEATDDLQQQYQAAFELVRNKQYSKAITRMQAFTDAHPDSALSGNAHYWLGQLYLTQGDNKQAMTEFNTVINQYPQNSKVSDAMLKLGLVYYDEGKWQEAKGQLNQVVKRYPNSSPAKLASARLQQMQRQGI